MVAVVLVVVIRRRATAAVQPVLPSAASHAQKTVPVAAAVTNVPLQVVVGEPAAQLPVSTTNLTQQPTPDVVDPVAAVFAVGTKPAVHVTTVQVQPNHGTSTQRAQYRRFLVLVTVVVVIVTVC